MAATMKALVIRGPRDARIETVPIPEVGPDDVLVKVSYCGICGTDLMIYGGIGSLIDAGRITYPIRIGHEWSGRVEKVGQQVTKFQKGDLVVGDSGVACGKCDACKKQDYRNCKDIRSVGTVECWDGGFAEYILIPERHLFHVAESVGEETAALIEPLTLAAKAIEVSELNENKTVYISGTGAIGLSAVGLASQCCNARVVLGGRTPAKMQRGIQLGAEAAVDTTKPDAIEQLKTVFPDGADVVMEASGAVSALNQGALAMAKYGSLCVIGFYERMLDGFDIDTFCMKAGALCGITGDFGLPGKVSRMLESCKELDLSPIITRRIGLEDVPAVLEEMYGKHNDEIKVMVRI